MVQVAPIVLHQSPKEFWKLPATSLDRKDSKCECLKKDTIIMIMVVIIVIIIIMVVIIVIIIMMLVGLLLLTGNFYVSVGMRSVKYPTNQPTWTDLDIKFIFATSFMLRQATRN